MVKWFLWQTIVKRKSGRDPVAHLLSPRSSAEGKELTLCGKDMGYAVRQPAPEGVRPCRRCLLEADEGRRCRRIDLRWQPGEG